WRHGNVFLALGIIPGLAALAVFVWSFAHLPWWEPVLTSALGVAIVGPLAVLSLKALGDGIYTIAFLLSPVAALLLAAWALGFLHPCFPGTVAFPAPGASPAPRVGCSRPPLPSGPSGPASAPPPPPTAKGGSAQALQKVAPPLPSPPSHRPPASYEGAMRRR